MTPEEKLDQLAEFQSRRDALQFEQDAHVRAIQAEQQAEIAKHYTPEIQAKVDEIERTYQAQIADLGVEYAGKSEAVDANIAKLETEIREDVKAHGSTVKGKYLMAVWNKGKPSYSEKPEDGYLPFNGFRKIGEPSVAIRKV